VLILTHFCLMCKYFCGVFFSSGEKRVTVRIMFIFSAVIMIVMLIHGHQCHTQPRYQHCDFKLITSKIASNGCLAEKKPCQ
jgi:hypothetical protein